MIFALCTCTRCGTDYDCALSEDEYGHVRFDELPDRTLCDGCIDDDAEERTNTEFGVAPFCGYFRL